jgi:plastocyanin
MKKHNTLLPVGIALMLAWVLVVVSCTDSRDKSITIPPQNDSLVQSNAPDTAAALLPQAGPHKSIIEIKKMQFTPSELTIHAGDTVVWINNDLTNHCITEIHKGWTSSTLVPGKYWQKVIKKTTDYYCALHLVMKGKIVVE